MIFMGVTWGGSVYLEVGYDFEASRSWTKERIFLGKYT